MQTKTYSRGQLAKLSQVKAETIRYYENCGLLAAPPRSEGGHRIYGDQHAKQLIFIRRCRELGFTIAEIDGLLGLASDDKRSCKDVKQLTEAHLLDVKNKIRDLKKIQKSLGIMVEECAANTSPRCPIIDVLSL
jgi:MerR family mercuric resistance operon transcriptional regulator